MYQNILTRSAQLGVLFILKAWYNNGSSSTRPMIPLERIKYISKVACSSSNDMTSELFWNDFQSKFSSVPTDQLLAENQFFDDEVRGVLAAAVTHGNICVALDLAIELIKAQALFR